MLITHLLGYTRVVSYISFRHPILLLLPCPFDNTLAFPKGVGLGLSKTGQTGLLKPPSLSESWILLSDARESARLRRNVSLSIQTEAKAIT